MQRFALYEPRSLGEACSAFAADPEAKPIAGGTALLTVIKQGLLAPIERRPRARPADQTGQDRIGSPR